MQQEGVYTQSEPNPWVSKAAAAMSSIDPADTQPDIDNLTNMLTDLRHWARYHNVDWNIALNRAHYHYEAEA